MEIEADYRRKMLAKKFRQKLKIIQNIEMDEMDLKKALDRIRAEFRSDTESLAQSEAALSLPDDGAFVDGVSMTPTYQRGSQITLGFSLEDLQHEVQMTPLRRMSTSVTGFFRGIPGWFRRNYQQES
ncbi:uncharacterized protein LOC119105710 [Pollicipes pollicipes]|uniref:uncharacterized protein LOC119105710 n=1 Tax=Pollicipes pollicipes TaxID=41117 RepID=UPI00188597B8|nr:uncharacterized protein LOC119105710 [Pollicipes pollicipes]